MIKPNPTAAPTIPITRTIAAVPRMVLPPNLNPHVLFCHRILQRANRSGASASAPNRIATKTPPIAFAMASEHVVAGSGGTWWPTHPDLVEPPRPHVVLQSQQRVSACCADQKASLPEMPSSREASGSSSVCSSWGWSSSSTTPSGDGRTQERGSSRCPYWLGSVGAIAYGPPALLVGVSTACCAILLPLMVWGGIVSRRAGTSWPQGQEPDS